MALLWLQLQSQMTFPLPERPLTGRRARRSGAGRAASAGAMGAANSRTQFQPSPEPAGGLLLGAPHVGDRHHSPQGPDCWHAPKGHRCPTSRVYSEGDKWVSLRGRPRPWNPCADSSGVHERTPCHFHGPTAQSAAWETGAQVMEMASWLVTHSPAGWRWLKQIEAPAGRAVCP